jgi:hypothetical protein
MVMEVDARWPIVDINKVNNKWMQLGQDDMDPLVIFKHCKIKSMVGPRTYG